MIFSERVMAVQTDTVIKQLYEKNGIYIKNTVEMPISFVDLVDMIETNNSPPVPPILAALAEVGDRFIFRKSKSRLQMPEMEMSIFFDLDNTGPIKPSITENDLYELGFCNYIRKATIAKPYSIYRYPLDSYNVFVRIFDL